MESSTQQQHQQILTEGASRLAATGLAPGSDVSSDPDDPTDVDIRHWPDAEELAEARERIRPYADVTPVMTSSLLDSMASKRLFFKCEHLQRTGSFKIRGALNALLTMPSGYDGVVTHSSGNHGQALAWAAAKFKCPCTVVVPADTPANKVSAIRSYGAEVAFCRPSCSDRRRLCRELALQRRLYQVPSSDSWRVIAGQASVGLELLDQVPDLDAVLVPISGGGLASGVALAASLQRRRVRVFCVEPAGKRLAPSLAAGRPLWDAPDEFVDTAAEAMRRRAIGRRPLAVLHRLAERRVLSVTDAGMADGVALCARYLKQTVEAAGGAAVCAGVRAAAVQLPPEVQRIGVLLSGGNLDPFSPEFGKLAAALGAACDEGELATSG